MKIFYPSYSLRKTNDLCKTFLKISYFKAKTSMGFLHILHKHIDFSTSITLKVWQPS